MIIRRKTLKKPVIHEVDGSHTQPVEFAVGCRWVDRPSLHVHDHRRVRGHSCSHREQWPWAGAARQQW
jgi:hypothetical protein